MSKDGIETDSKKTATIKEWLVPKTVTEVWGFLGFTNYCQKFIEKCTYCKAYQSVGVWREC